MPARPVTPHARPLHIDGSIGEGGGQVLRTALTLSLITGRPFSMTNIRRARPKAGLMAQHLAAVEAAVAVGMARAEGARLGSQILTFEPAQIRCGTFEFSIGTAGSTSLLLQTVLLPLSFATAGSTVIAAGGTHVPWSPSFHFLDLHWRLFLRRIGFLFGLELEAAGFYPAGGGRVRATVEPCAALSPLRLSDRGAFRRVHGLSAVANLDLHIAERQKRRALERLADVRCAKEIEIVELPAHSRGTLLLLIAEFDDSRACFSALGARGKPAERVADEAADALLEFLATDGAVDPHLADQLIVPLALAPGTSELRTSRLTRHLTTNIEVVRMFLPAVFEVKGQGDQPGLVRILGGGHGHAA